jgi:hypothetical protein
MKCNKEWPGVYSNKTHVHTLDCRGSRIPEPSMRWLQLGPTLLRDDSIKRLVFVVVENRSTQVKRRKRESLLY